MASKTELHCFTRISFKTLFQNCNAIKHRLISFPPPAFFFCFLIIHNYFPLALLTFDPFFILPLNTGRPGEQFYFYFFFTTLAHGEQFCVGSCVTERGANEPADQSLKP